MEEIWKDIVDYEGLYQVSNLGRVKSLERINGRGIIVKERILKHGNDGKGYLMVGINKNGIQKTRKIHQLVAESFLNHKPCGKTIVVNHKNFIRSDNRLENLEIVTMRENGNQKHLKSTSKYTGVSWDPFNNKWKAQIYINKKTKNLGRFSTEEEAYSSYLNALNRI